MLTLLTNGVWQMLTSQTKMLTRGNIIGPVLNFLSKIFVIQGEGVKHMTWLTWQKWGVGNLGKCWHWLTNGGGVVWHWLSKGGGVVDIICEQTPSNTSWPFLKPQIKTVSYNFISCQVWPEAQFHPRGSWRRPPGRDQGHHQTQPPGSWRGKLVSQSPLGCGGKGWPGPGRRFACPE